MKRTHLSVLGGAWGRAVLAAAVVAGGAWACGLETLGIDTLSGEALDKSLAVIRGSHGLGAADFVVLDGDGKPLEDTIVELEEGSYTVRLPPGSFRNVRVVATEGERVVKAVVPDAAPRTTSTADLSAESTTAAVMLEAASSAFRNRLGTLSVTTSSAALAGIAADIAAGGPAATLRDMIVRVQSAANTGGETPSLRQPELDDAFAVVTSALDPAWVSAARPDLDGDGAADTASTVFDAALAAAAQGAGLCIDTELVRTILVADFNEGRKSGICGVINRFKWVKDEPGKQMFFVGGIHEDSPSQDPNIEAMLGAWSPNQVPMYDDGTHGDETASDNVWSVTFDLPPGLRIGYKYTWGKQGDVWTGTEEWPGNQRILEIVDVNGDEVIYRYDNFGDEASNKDRVNLNPNVPGGTLTWTTDANGDGVPDARERQVDADNNCSLDEWVTPEWIGPALGYCG